MPPQVRDAGGVSDAAWRRMAPHQLTLCKFHQGGLVGLVGYFQAHL